VGKELEEMLILLGRLRLDRAAENQYNRVLRKIEAHDPSALQRVRLRLEKDLMYQISVFVANLTPLKDHHIASLVVGYITRDSEEKQATPFIPSFSTHTFSSRSSRLQGPEAEFYPSWRHKLFDSDFRAFMAQAHTNLDKSNYRLSRSGVKDLDNNTLLTTLKLMIREEENWDEITHSKALRDHEAKKEAALRSKLSRMKEKKEALERRQKEREEEEQVRRQKERQEREELKNRLDAAAAKEEPRRKLGEGPSKLAVLLPTFPSSSLSASPAEGASFPPVMLSTRRGSEPSVEAISPENLPASVASPAEHFDPLPPEKSWLHDGESLDIHQGKMDVLEESENDEEPQEVTDPSVNPSVDPPVAAVTTTNTTAMGLASPVPAGGLSPAVEDSAFSTPVTAVPKKSISKTPLETTPVTGNKVIQPCARSLLPPSPNVVHVLRMCWSLCLSPCSCCVAVFGSHQVIKKVFVRQPFGHRSKILIHIYTFFFFPCVGGRYDTGGITISCGHDGR
jgi:hypothetical protein